MRLAGRRPIYCHFNEINAGNVVEALGNALAVFNQNCAEITYLYDYYRGITPILDRIKKVRPEICNKTNVNRAHEIVRFKVGYQFGKPLQYCSVDGSERTADAVNLLNEYMRLISKATKDIEIAKWQLICGTAYRLILPNPDDLTEDDAPFEIHTIDPRDVFVIYSSKIGHKPLAGVIQQKDKNGETYYSVYTKYACFTVKNGELISSEAWSFNTLPVIEYPLDESRIGAFELVVPLLDALDVVTSNRIDGIEQFVSSLLIFYNCTLDDETDIDSLREKGLVFLKSIGENKADIKQICDELNQSQTQTLVDDLEDKILTICAMPNRGSNGGTSDNGIAVIYRDGWSDAATFSKQWEGFFIQSETNALKLILEICRNRSVLTDIYAKDIKPQFSAQYYENVQTKAQVLTTLLGSDKVHPKVAYEVCGLFPDVEEAIKLGLEWYEENTAKETVEVIEKPNKTNSTEETETLETVEEE